MNIAPQPTGFADIAHLIVQAKRRAVQAVNTTLIELYWQIGERISRKIAASEWGDGPVEQLARYLAQMRPGLRRFTRRNLFRMKQFYDAYAHHELLMRHEYILKRMPWTHHLFILSQGKRPDFRPVHPELVEGYFVVRQAHHERRLTHHEWKLPHHEWKLPHHQRKQSPVHPELVEGYFVVRQAHHERRLTHHEWKLPHHERRLSHHERRWV